jgi:hypothetical protein
MGFGFVIAVGAVLFIQRFRFAVGFGGFIVIFGGRAEFFVEIVEAVVVEFVGQQERLNAPSRDQRPAVRDQTGVLGRGAGCFGGRMPRNRGIMRARGAMRLRCEISNGWKSAAAVFPRIGSWSAGLCPASCEWPGGARRCGGLFFEE